jgi:hypothetical protein
MHTIAFDDGGLTLTLNLRDESWTVLEAAQDIVMKFEAPAHTAEVRRPADAGFGWPDAPGGRPRRRSHEFKAIRDDFERQHIGRTDLSQPAVHAPSKSDPATDLTLTDLLQRLSVFVECDTDEGGFLSRVECMRMPREKMRAKAGGTVADHFDEIDTDKDGRITFAELFAAAELVDAAVVPPSLVPSLSAAGRRPDALPWPWMQRQPMEGQLLRKLDAVFQDAERVAQVANESFVRLDQGCMLPQNPKLTRFKPKLLGMTAVELNPWLADLVGQPGWLVAESDLAAEVMKFYQSIEPEQHSRLVRSLNQAMAAEAVAVAALAAYRVRAQACGDIVRAPKLARRDSRRAAYPSTLKHAHRVTARRECVATGRDIRRLCRTRQSRQVHRRTTCRPRSNFNTSSKCGRRN